MNRAALLAVFGIGALAFAGSGIAAPYQADLLNKAGEADQLAENSRIMGLLIVGAGAGVVAIGAHREDTLETLGGGGLVFLGAIIHFPLGGKYQQRAGDRRAAAAQASQVAAGRDGATPNGAAGAVARLKAIQGIAVQEGIEVEKIIILADAGSLAAAPASVASVSGGAATRVPVLEQVAGVLRASPEAEVELIGHANAAGRGAPEAARLALARAESARDYLVVSERLPPDRFSVKGRVGTEPGAREGREGACPRERRAANDPREAALLTQLAALDFTPGVAVARWPAGRRTRIVAHEAAIRFPPNSSEPSTASRESLAEIIRNVAWKLRAESGLRAEIEGHTDGLGPADVNARLSFDRASRVRAALLEENGIDPSRLSCRGCGPARPVAGNDTPDGREKNRRVEIVLIEEAP